MSGRLAPKIPRFDSIARIFIPKQTQDTGPQEVTTYYLENKDEYWQIARRAAKDHDYDGSTKDRVLELLRFDFRNERLLRSGLSSTACYQIFRSMRVRSSFCNVKKGRSGLDPLESMLQRMSGHLRATESIEIRLAVLEGHL